MKGGDSMNKMQKPQGSSFIVKASQQVTGKTKGKVQTGDDLRTVKSGGVKAKGAM